MNISQPTRCEIGPSLASAFGVVLLTASAAIVAIAWRIAVLAIANALQSCAIANTLQSYIRVEHAPKLGQQWGGGEHAGEHADRVTRIAGGLRQFGETVNAPSMKAIMGVLLVLENDISQALTPPPKQVRRSKASASTDRSSRKCLLHSALLLLWQARWQLPVLRSPA